jgi:hypothetical protein
MRNLIAVTFSFLALAASATGGTYYVDSSAPDAIDSGPGNRARPWKSLAAVDSHTFTPGDVIYFARGSSYRGGFTAKDSGSAGRPITFAAFGTGPAPAFSNPDYAVLNGNVIQVRGSYVVIDGLYFHDGAQSSSDRMEDVLKVGDVYIVKGADHAVVRNCEFKSSPIGIHVNGQFALVTRNHLHDCNRFLAGTAWGPIAIMISNANNEFSHNRITNYLSVGGKYGADGGAFEIDPRVYGDTIHDVRIHHNYSYGNEGFLEVAQARDTISVSYNVSNDYQEFVILYEGANCLFENNTVLRVLPKNTITNVVFTFHQDGSVIRNNIFIVNSGKKVFSTNGTEVWGRDNYAGQKRRNNLYFSVDGSQEDPCGLPLGPGEKIGNPEFLDYAKQDFHLKPGSPAIDAGWDIGLSEDFDGTPVPQGKAPDIGAYEFKRK